MIELKLQDPSLTVGEEFAMMRVLHRKRRQNRAATRRRYEHKRRCSGGCILCPAKASPGDRWCQRCRERNRAYNKRYRG